MVLEKSGVYAIVDRLDVDVVKECVRALKNDVKKYIKDIACDDSFENAVRIKCIWSMYEMIMSVSCLDSIPEDITRKARKLGTLIFNYVREKCGGFDKHAFVMSENLRTAFGLPSNGKHILIEQTINQVEGYPFGFYDGVISGIICRLCNYCEKLT